MKNSIEQIFIKSCVIHDKILYSKDFYDLKNRCVYYRENTTHHADYIFEINFVTLVNDEEYTVFYDKEKNIILQLIYFWKAGKISYYVDNIKLIYDDYMNKYIVTFNNHQFLLDNED